MIIHGRVTMAQENGNSLIVRMEGRTRRAAHDRRATPQQIEVPNTKDARAAFYVGRAVEISVKPK